MSSLGCKSQLYIGIAQAVRFYLVKHVSGSGCLFWREGKQKWNLLVSSLQPKVMEPQQDNIPEI